MTTEATLAPAPAAVMVQAREENFPVASILVGRTARRHLLAIYGFARLVDDIGDEAPGDREALLDWLDDELGRVFGGQPPEHPLMQSLALAVRECPLPEAPFRRLVLANRQDQRVSRYETFDELLGYCQLSAAPVGELVLHVFGAATEQRIAWSDGICAGLQVIEHLQDVGEDYAQGRIYLPQEDLRRFGCEERDLIAAHASDRLRALLAYEASRARLLLAAGAPLTPTLAPRPRLTVAGFLAGGRAALGGLAQVGYDVLGEEPPKRPPRTFAKAFIAAMVGR